MKKLLTALVLYPITLLAALPVIPNKTPDAKLPDGSRYYGPLKNGLLEGEGLLVYPNGSLYKGQFVAGLLQGKGEKYSAGKRLYSGNFVRGLWEGQGTLTKDAHTTYIGQFKQGKMEGTGKLTILNQYTYTGEFKNNQPNGKGHYVTQRGDVYEGDFVNGRFTGQGKATIGQDVYEGKFEDFALSGFGKHHSPTIESEGTFKNYELEGQGKQTDQKTKERYVGMFKYGQPEGIGSFYYANGDIYTGEVQYGKPDGKGELKLAKPNAKGQTRIKGRWDYGEYKDEAEERRQLLQLENAIYQQPMLLKQALDNVQPSRHQGIQMYWLGIAGDGTQEVFRREVDFVGQQFDRYFGTRQHRVSLIYSRNTLTNSPMATLTSVEASVNSIASKMDKQNDILFLYMTSHGSHDHVFSLEQTNLSLRGITSKDLATVLKKSGIQWKVLVISACYAGGFIPDLKDDHTLILTAARADRPSFGCSDGNDFTYFGRAFFKESLTRNGDFITAFGKAKNLITQWEKKDQEAAKGDSDAPHPSEPQISEGKLIGTYLKTWAAQLTSK